MELLVLLSDWVLLKLCYHMLDFEVRSKGHIEAAEGAVHLTRQKGVDRLTDAAATIPTSGDVGKNAASAAGIRQPYVPPKSSSDALVLGHP
jgi:hypothetical protein